MTNSELFFDEYAKTYQRYDEHAIADYYLIPAVIMSDDRKQVFASESDIADHVRSLMDKLVQVGVRHCRPQVANAMRLSENITFVNVRWTFLDDCNEKVFSCFVSYTLQKVDNDLKIIISVIDDEEQHLTELL